MNMRLQYVMGVGWYAETQNDMTGSWAFRSMALPTIDEAVAHLARLVGKPLFVAVQWREADRI